jgi:hypothetical protein
MTRTASKAAMAALLGLSLLATGACTRTQQYAATGAGLGAAGGAVIGAATGGNALTGAVIGGTAGAVTGVVLAQ